MSPDDVRGAPRAPLHPAPLDEAATALKRLGDSIDSNSELGIDARKGSVLEVVSFWRGDVQEVRHFDPSGARVQLGDRRLGAVKPWSTLLTALLVFGLGAFMIRHATLPTPPRFMPGDEARVASWEAEVEAARVARIAEAAAARQAEELESDDESSDPAPEAAAEWRDPLADFQEGWLAEGDALMEAALRDDPGADPLDLAFEILGRPGYDRAYESVLRGEVLATARIEAAEGQLSRSHVSAFERFEVEYPDDPDELPPTVDERVARRALHAELAELLYADATAKRAIGQQCRALAEIAVTESRASDFVVQARHARCLHRSGETEAAAPVVALALELAPSRPQGEEAVDLGAVLRARAEQLTGAATQDAEIRPEAIEAWGDLRDLVIEPLHDPGLLSVADRGIEGLRAAALADRERKLAGRAFQFSLVLLVLLPLGFLLDERRGRRNAPDFDVPGWDLPSEPFTLVEEEGGELFVGFGRDSVVSLRDGSSSHSGAELAGRERTEDVGGHLRVPLAEGQTFLQQVGDQVFLVRHVPAAAAIPASIVDNADWRWMGTLAAVLLFGAGLAVVANIAPVRTGMEILTSPGQRTITLAAPVLEQDLPKSTGSDEGERAKDAEGAAGTPDAPVVPEARFATRKEDRDRELVDDLLNDMIGPGHLTLSTDGMSDRIASAAAQLGTGPIGTSRGHGGGGFRGPGPGGGGWRDGPGGYGIDGAGTGRRGRPGPGRWTSDRREPQGPTVDTSGAIVLSSMDKSAIDRVVKTHLSSLRYCYQRELTTNHELGGKVVIKFVISKDGTVSQSTVKSSSMDQPIVERCLTERFLRMRFPKPKGKGIVMVSYPLVFSAAGQ